MAIEQARSHQIVAIGEDCRIHKDFLARNAPHRTIAPINLRGHILNHNALAAIAWLHSNQLRNSWNGQDKDQAG
jgi:hypothetical protein